MIETWSARETRIVACERCPELRAYCATVAREKKRAHRDATYWGRPVPAFGDPAARLLLVGLAPGAHGSNRTGRMFTGDASGEWLYRALYRADFANQPTQRDRDDGLVLHDTLITAAVRCAPPANKPTPEQRRRCFPYLVEEVAALPDLRVVVGLGAIGTAAAEAALVAAGYASEKRHVFGHGTESSLRRGPAETAQRAPAKAPQSGASTAAARGPTNAAQRDTPNVTLLSSYHPSRQNTNTGVLTEAMLDAIFARARTLLSGL